MIPFLKIFSDPLFAGRLLSAISGIGTMVGIFILTHLLFKSKKAALFGAFIYAVVPFAVFFDRMALVDSMLSMFGVWTFIFALISVRFLRLDMAMLGGFALGGALLTKSPAVFYSLLVPATIIFTKLPKGIGKISLSLIKVISFWIAMWGIGYAMFNILRLGPNFHMLTSRNKDYLYPISHLWENSRDPLVFYFDRAIEWLTSFGVYLLLPLGALGVVGNIKKHFREIIFLLVLGFAPIIIQSEFAKVFTARYIFFTLPYFVILASSAFIIFKGNLQKYLMLIFFGFLILSLTYDYQLLTNPEKAPLPRSERSGYLEEWTAGTGIREAADIIRAEYNDNPKQKIVVGTEGYFGTLPDGMQLYLNDLTDITVIGVGLDFSEVPKSLLESKEFGNKTYLVANSSRINFHKDLSEFGLKEIASFKKADRPLKTKDYNRYGLYDTFYLLELE